MEENQNQENQVEEKNPNETLKNVLCAVLICVVFVAIIASGIWSANRNKSDNFSESEETVDEFVLEPDEEYSFGDTFTWNDFEFTVGDAEDCSFTMVDNDYSEGYGKKVIVIPVTVKNLKNKPRSRFDLDYMVYKSYKHYIYSVNYLFRDDIYSSDTIESGETVESAFHVRHDGAGTYSIWLDDLSSTGHITCTVISFDVSPSKDELETDTEAESEPDTTPEPVTNPVTEPATEPPATAAPDREYASGGNLINDTPAKQPAAQSPAPQPSSPAPPAKENTKPPAGTYASGKYKVGTDIPAGEYFLQATSSFGYMSVNRDSSGDLYSIIENQNFVSHYYVTVKDGQYLELQFATAIPAKDMSKTFDASNLGEGMYRVGIDIPAGEYKFTTTTGFGHFCVYNNSGVDHEVQAINNFETTDYVTVSNGQYLFLSFCAGSIVQ